MKKITKFDIMFIDFIIWGLLGFTVAALYSLLRALFVTYKKETKTNIIFNRLSLGTALGLILYSMLFYSVGTPTEQYIRLIVCSSFIVFQCLVFLTSGRIERMGLWSYFENFVVTLIITSALVVLVIAKSKMII